MEEALSGVALVVISIIIVWVVLDILLGETKMRTCISCHKQVKQLTGTGSGICYGMWVCEDCDTSKDPNTQVRLFTKTALGTSCYSGSTTKQEAEVWINRMQQKHPGWTFWYEEV